MAEAALDAPRGLAHRVAADVEVTLLRFPGGVVSERRC